MKSQYQISYEIKNDDMYSGSYGYIISKTKKVPTLQEAVQFSRTISNNALVVGKPIIEERV